MKRTVMEEIISLKHYNQALDASNRVVGNLHQSSDLRPGTTLVYRLVIASSISNVTSDSIGEVKRKGTVLDYSLFRLEFISVHVWTVQGK